MTFDRRRFMKAMGLTAGSLFLPSLLEPRVAHAGAPKRLVLFLTEHGPVTGRWEMRRPGLPDAMDWEFPLDDPDPMSFSEMLRPLHAHRADINILEGLSMASAFADPEFGGNGHASSVPNRVAAQGGVSSASIDQLIAEVSTPPGGFSYLFYTNGSCDCWAGSPIFDTAGNQVQPGRLGGFSFLPNAFERVFGALPDEMTPMGPPTPAELSRQRRANTLGLVEAEYTRLLGRLDADDRAKLTRHRDMVADLERRLGASGSIVCERPAFPESGLSDLEVTDITLQQLFPVAMACDLTRVAVLGTTQLDADEFGAPTDLDVHQDVAHESSADPASTWMTNYYQIHARQFAGLVEAFKSVPEGSGTMLDNSLLLWIPELGNGWHDLFKLMIVMAGGAGGAFRTGRYLKYRETFSSPENGYDVPVGLPHSKFLVSVLNAFGVDRNAMGVTSARAHDGSTIDFTGPLPNL
jgi:hypothetical protein